LRHAEAALVLAMRLAALLVRIECAAGSVDEVVVFRLGASLTKLYTARQAVVGASEVDGAA
jgi:hypothetical protein